MKKYLFLLGAMLLFAAPSFAQTATPTATATATPTASPSPTATAPAAASTPLGSGLTDFGFLAADVGNYKIYGGYVIRQTATAALLLGQIVKPDASNDSSVVVSTSGTTDPIGVVIGSSGYASCNKNPGVGSAPCAGQKALVQVSGVALVQCDIGMPAGTKVMSSTLINGMVGAYVAGTVDEQIGVMLAACTVGTPAPMLIYK